MQLSLIQPCLTLTFTSAISPPTNNTPHFIFPPFSFSNPKESGKSRERKCTNSRSNFGTAMPSTCSTSIEAASGGGNLRSLKHTEASFLASLMPKREIGADRFLDSYPEYDGRGVVIAIFDSGVDPAASGLQVTSDGKPKVLDVLDCTGSGDVDTSTVVKADADGCIVGASGAPLVVNHSWKNPSGEWHVGCKLVYELFTKDLTSRLKKERRKKWDEKNQEAIADAVKKLSEFDQKHTKVEDVHLKRLREDLQSRIDFLQKQANSYEDKGPVIDAVVWHDGEFWRVALDTQSLEDKSGKGKLADFVPLTNYRIERKFGIFSKLDACSFVTNVYEEGNVLSIVTDCSPHGTHVAGIATAYHPEEPLLNGVAPGAQIISCKIGDTRLGSMETGTGLTRALIAAVEHKCDLINMSYGEPSLLPDYGRFVDLVNEAVNKHHIVFVSSAGNEGPALSTVGAPGGTTSSIIGIGAYVSPAMASGAHCVVEPPSEGLEYTWSSRGPTADGDIGVSVSAPGGAVAPVPTWTLQCRMLMNGTSMSSPCACGGVALLISAMKAEGVHVSPYSVRKAIENTCAPISSSPEDRLTTGMGLMQVDKAFEYISQSRDLPSIWYEVKVNFSGKSKPTFRGIYLREASACQQASEWTVQVAPKFHEDASTLDDLVPFEECIELHSSDTSVVRAPEYLLLTNNGRSFNVIVDPSQLEDGVHYFEVYGIDSKAPWRGPLFRIPVTITKPMILINSPPVISFAGMQFCPGHIERKYIVVPLGATWVEATMRTSGFDTSRRFFVDTVQLSPLKRYLKSENVVTFSSPSAQTFSFAVEGGRTIELAVAQFWSSGVGSQETTMVDFEIEFHGFKIKNEEINLGGCDAPKRIDVGCLLSSEKLAPSATLNKIRIPLRPVATKLRTLPSNRDRLPSGKQILSLTLTYKFKLEEAAEIKPDIPLLNNRVYDTKFESQLYMISDANKRIYALGDVYPKAAKVPKGDWTLQLYLRHDNVQLLEKMKTLVIFIEKTLENKEVIQLSFYSQPDGHVVGNSNFQSSILVPGSEEVFYVGPPAKDKLPKNCPEGALLVGAMSYGRLSFSAEKGGGDPEHNPVSYEISYMVPPNQPNEDKGKDASVSSEKTVSERLEEEVRDAKIKVLTSLKHNSDAERSEWKKLSLSLKSEYPNYTPLLAKILEGVLSEDNVEDKCFHLQEQVIDAAEEVIKSIDRDELAKYLSQKSVPEDDEEEKTKKEMETRRDQLADALYQKGLALSEMESLKAGDQVETISDAEQDLFESTYKELRKWVDVKSSRYGIISVIRERRSRRLGLALKVLNDIIQDDGLPPKKKLYDLKLSLIEEIGWEHMASYERQWMHVRFPPSLPLF
ncbi:tripeptidyl-peptidase 2 isoform X1 [Amaranthus tricolor]|uniref:tripeptidyl-peptidase 2 isoform X1 n=1 Tax=Amaranthus tricolor TaxID=29722 RepID=UPI00258ED46D|nr:tripeptidyl-peptidase 2 isoform X1 [Amaranthus tricolor]